MDENEDELRRWQDAIRNEVIKQSGAPDCDIDGGGCESGDPLDLTLTEIRQGFRHVKESDEVAAACRELIEAFDEHVAFHTDNDLTVGLIFACKRVRAAIAKGG